MKAAVIGGGELTPEQSRRWSALQEADPRFASPYLTPEFTAAAAAVRDDVFIGLLEQDGELVGFFPFQLAAPGEGGPVGDEISDVQAVVTAPHARWTAAELLRGCGLARWRFTNVPVAQEPFRPYHETHYDFTYMDLAGGFEAWSRARRDAGSSLLGDVARRRRRLEREAGPVRFAAHVADRDTLHRLLRLKSAQYLRTGKWDRFAVPWIVALLERLHACQKPRLAGLLSVLYAGGEIAAAHLGLRYGPIWHSWFPAYDLRFAACSPGLILDLEMAAAAEGMGVRRFDLGRKNRHKQRLMSGAFAVASGCARRGGS